MGAGLVLCSEVSHRSLFAHGARIGSSLRFSICMATGPYRHDGRDIDVGVLEMGQHGLRGAVLWRPIRRSRPTWSVHVSAALVMVALVVISRTEDLDEAV